jgi:uncharacterized protein (DUF2336 family)
MSFSNFSKLAALAAQTSSDARRDLLREVTAVLDNHNRATPEELAGVDEALAAAASQFSVEVRREFARLIANSISGFERITEQLAMDEISISASILQHSRIISQDVLLKVIREKSDDHRMQITARKDLSETLSDALVQHGSDTVVIALLKNETAKIGDETYEAVAKRAEANTALASPLVQRKGVPLDLLQELYHKVEGELRQEIVAKFGQVAPEELDRAFARSRERISKAHRAVPDDFDAASQRVNDIKRRGCLKPPVLVTLLREGVTGRTTFKLAFARLTEVEFDIVDRAVEARDLDTVALLCRGTGLERAIFVALALALQSPEGTGRAGEDFAQAYESVPVQAAQRALRFWKVRHAEAAA